MTSHRLSLSEALGSCTTIIAAITANQEAVEFYLRCGASVVAIMVGLATVWSIFFKKKPQ